MPHSDHTTGDEALTREVVRQLADLAPPAPSWEVVADRTAGAAGRGGTPSSWGPLAMVAAVVLAIAAGLLFVVRQPAGEPADPPVPTLPVPTSAVVAEWLAVADPAEAQLCVARATARLVRMADVGPLDDESDLAGVTPERADLVAYTSPVVLMRAVVATGEADPAATASVVPVVDAWERADAVVVDRSSTSVDRRAAVASFEEALDGHLDTPANLDCVFERAGVDAAVQSAAARLGPLTTARCISALGLDRALTDLADRGDRSADALLEASLAGFTVWDNRPPPEITDLAGEVVAFRDTDPADREQFVAGVRTRVAGLEVVASCPTWARPDLLAPD